MIVTEDVLPTEQHLQLRIFKPSFQLAKSLPRIFFQETQRSVKRRPAPALDRVIADLIHLVNDRKHLLRRHTGSDQRLMGITKDCLCYFNWLFFHVFRHVYFLLI